MVAELGQTTDPKALVPGDHPAVFENARVLHERARDVSAVVEALRRIDTGGWQGEASNTFHEAHRTEVPRWEQGGESLENAALSLTDFSNCLSWAQDQAADAIAQWQRGDAATQQARTAHDKAVADAQTQTQANASHGDPTVVQAPPFTDPGEAQRQAARDTLNRARQQVTEVGDRCAEEIRAEADIAPQDSQKQADANFFGGIWDTFKGAAEGLWNAVNDPAGAVAAMVDNIFHPVETFKDLVAWDDWANGRGDRALGKITGSLLLLGAGKLAKLALRRAGHHEPHPDGEGRPDGEAPATPKRIYEPTRNRVKLRVSTIRVIIRDASRTPDGTGFECESSGKIIPAETNPDGSLVRINPDTGKPDPHGMTVPKGGTYDFGHRSGEEWWRYKQKAEAGGYSRERVIEDQNDPSTYQVEDRAANRSRKHELPP